MCLDRQERADPGLRLGTTTSTRLQQLPDLSILLVDQELDVPWRLRRYRQHAMRQMIDEPLLELALQEVVEHSHGRPGVRIQQPLRDVVVPVLLVISKGVNGPKRARLLPRQLHVFRAQVDALLEADGVPELPVEDRNPSLDQGRLQEHLERML